MFKGSRQKCQYVPPVILQLEEENCKLCEETQFHLEAAQVKRALPFPLASNKGSITHNFDNKTAIW